MRTRRAANYISQARIQVAGWRIFPYFADPGTYTVEIIALHTASHVSDATKVVLNPHLSTTISVVPVTRASKKSTMAYELGQAVLIQMIPLFALIAKNSGELATRDPFAASLILITAGFGTDVAKTVIMTGLTALTSRSTQPPPNQPAEASAVPNVPEPRSLVPAPAAPATTPAGGTRATALAVKTFSDMMKAVPRPARPRPHLGRRLWSPHAI